MSVVTRIESALSLEAWQSQPTITSGVVCVTIIAVFWLVGGIVGAGLGIVVGASLFVVPVIYVVALGHVVFAALLPSNAPLSLMLLGEVPLALLLGCSVRQRESWRRTGVVLGIGVTIISASVIVVMVTSRLWLAAVIIGGLVALPGYGLHRYAIITVTEGTNE